MCRFAVTIAAIAGFVCLVSFWDAPLGAAEVLDQQYDVSSAMGDTASRFSLEVGQTFTVGVAGVLGRIEVILARFPFTGDNAVLRVYDTTGGLPSNELASTVVSSSLVSMTTPAYVSFDVSSFALPVNVDDLLAFTIDSDTGGTYILPFPMNATYGGGTGVQRSQGPPPGAWQLVSTRDYGFRTYVNVADRLPGDFNNNGEVDAGDYVTWRHYRATDFNLNGNGDETGDSAGIVDDADYSLWRSSFGNVINEPGAGATTLNVLPEPLSWPLFLWGGIWLAASRLRPERSANSPN